MWLSDGNYDDHIWGSVYEHVVILTNVLVTWKNWQQLQSMSDLQQEESISNIISYDVLSCLSAIWQTVNAFEDVVILAFTETLNLNRMLIISYLAVSLENIGIKKKCIISFQENVIVSVTMHWSVCAPQIQAVPFPK